MVALILDVGCTPYVWYRYAGLVFSSLFQYTITVGLTPRDASCLKL